MYLVQGTDTQNYKELMYFHNIVIKVLPEQQNPSPKSRKLLTLNSFQFSF